MKAVRANVLYTGKLQEILYNVYLVYKGKGIKTISKKNQKEQRL